MNFNHQLCNSTANSTYKMSTTCIKRQVLSHDSPFNARILKSCMQRGKCFSERCRREELGKLPLVGGSDEVGTRTFAYCRPITHLAEREP